MPTSWSLAFVSLVCCSSATTASWNSPTGSVPILSDYNTNLLPTAFLRTGLAFGVATESSLTLACLVGLLRAAVYRKPAFGCVTALTLMDAKPPILIFKERCKQFLACYVFIIKPFKVVVNLFWLTILKSFYKQFLACYVVTITKAVAVVNLFFKLFSNYFTVSEWCVLYPTIRSLTCRNDSIYNSLLIS